MTEKIPHTPYKIGITGTIGAGKSAVGEILGNYHIPVLDTDTVVKTLYETHETLKTQLIAQFGKNIVDSQNNIDKNRLRDIVFNDPTQKSILENLVHPLVRQETQAFLQQATAPTVAVLIPLLFETQGETLYDETWAVITEESSLLPRLMARHHISQAEAKKRLANQWPQEKKARQASFIINNSGTLAETERQVRERLQLIQAQRTLA